MTSRGISGLCEQLRRRCRVSVEGGLGVTLGPFSLVGGVDRVAGSMIQFFIEGGQLRFDSCGVFRGFKRSLIIYT